MRSRYAAVLTLATALAASVAGAQPKKGSSSEPAIFLQEKSLYDALVKKDFATFNKVLGSDFVYVDGNGATHWELAKSAEMLKDCTTGKFTFEKVEATPVGTDLVVLTYKATGDQTCGGNKAPPAVTAMSVWRKLNGKWVAVAHSETPVMAAK